MIYFQCRGCKGSFTSERQSDFENRQCRTCSGEEEEAARKLAADLRFAAEEKRRLEQLDKEIAAARLVAAEAEARLFAFRQSAKPEKKQDTKKQRDQKRRQESGLVGFVDRAYGQSGVRDSDRY